MNEETDILSIMNSDVYQKVIEENIELKEENERLNTIINNIHNYIEKMSYCEVVDNPKKELSRILEKESDNYGR